MAPGRTESPAEQVAGSESPLKEYDPEDETSSDEDDEDEDDEVEDENEEELHPNSREEIKRIMNEEQKVIVSSISQTAKADAEKGRAVRQQRSTFNALLNSRIRLQKALISTNTLELEERPGNDAQRSDTIVEAAENAALKLWSSLNELREDLRAARTGQKRDRRLFDSSTPSSDLWTHMRSYEPNSISDRNSILNKWSTKTRTTAVTSNTSRLNPPSVRDETIVDVLTSHLADMPRLVKRARTPRSCAPIQASLPTPANSTDQPQAVYDDADLYSLLLKSLLEQTSADIDTSALSIPNQWQLARQAKTKKVVDTKASKGRKMRYTVHEKLQNFMAPEDKSLWGDRQRDELFAGLLGTKGNLVEEELTAREDPEEDGYLGDEKLMLFG